MVKPIIHVAIIYDSKNKSLGCDTGCGLDWSSTETIALIKQKIEERFGDSVKAEYLDLSEPEAGRRAAELKPATGSEDLLPLLVIDGQPRISGKFDIHLLLDAIDTEIEIKQDKV